jgi:hypothetical protein
MRAHPSQTASTPDGVHWARGPVAHLGGATSLTREDLPCPHPPLPSRAGDSARPHRGRRQRTRTRRRPRQRAGRLNGRARPNRPRRGAPARRRPVRAGRRRAPPRGGPRAGLVDDRGGDQRPRRGHQRRPGRRERAAYDADAARGGSAVEKMLADRRWNSARRRSLQAKAAVRGSAARGGIAVGVMSRPLAAPPARAHTGTSSAAEPRGCPSHPSSLRAPVSSATSGSRALAESAGAAYVLPAASHQEEARRRGDVSSQG